MFDAQPPPGVADFISANWKALLLMAGANNAVLLWIAKLVYEKWWRDAWDNNREYATAKTAENFQKRSEGIDVKFVWVDGKLHDLEGKVSVNSDKIEAAEASIIQQGTFLTGRFESSLNQIAKGMESTSKVLDEIRKDQSEIRKDQAAQSVKIARIDAFIEMQKDWDGHDRRNHRRREEDQL